MMSQLVLLLHLHLLLTTIFSKLGTESTPVIIFAANLFPQLLYCHSHDGYHHHPPPRPPFFPHGPPPPFQNDEMKVCWVNLHPLYFPSRFLSSSNLLCSFKILHQHIILGCFIRTAGIMDILDSFQHHLPVLLVRLVSWRLSPSSKCHICAGKKTRTVPNLPLM